MNAIKRIQAIKSFAPRAQITNFSRTGSEGSLIIDKFFTMLEKFDIIIVLAELNDSTRNMFNKDVNPLTSNMLEDIIGSFQEVVSNKGNPFESIMGITEKITSKYGSMIENGDIEIEISGIEILNAATTPIFECTESSVDINEEVRLKNRYLDLRTERMQSNMKMRHKARGLFHRHQQVFVQ